MAVTAVRMRKLAEAKVFLEESMDLRRSSREVRGVPDEVSLSECYSPPPWIHPCFISRRSFATVISTFKMTQFQRIWLLGPSQDAISLPRAYACGSCPLNGPTFPKLPNQRKLLLRLRNIWRYEHRSTHAHAYLDPPSKVAKSTEMAPTIIQYIRW